VAMGLTQGHRIGKASRFFRERVRIVIATKDSAGWFGEILQAYRKLAIRPLVLLDSASEDGTKALLEREHIEYARVVPEFPRIEAIVRLIPEHTDARWVLRLDDDEFPSYALIDWILDRLDGLDTNIVGIPRRWVRIGKSGHCEFSNHPLLKQDQDKMDIQWRSFRPDRVDYHGHPLPQVSGLSRSGRPGRSLSRALRLDRPLQASAGEESGGLRPAAERCGIGFP